MINRCPKHTGVSGIIAAAVLALAALWFGWLPKPAAAQTDSLAGTYITQLPAADASALEITLALNPDGSASLTQDYVGKAIFNETGTWIQDGARAIVTLTDKDGKPIKDNFVFELKGDQLVAIEFDKALWGEDGLALTREAVATSGEPTVEPAVAPATEVTPTLDAAATQPITQTEPAKPAVKPKPRALSGVYSALLPAADASGLAIALVLDNDGRAIMTNNYVGKISIIQTGTWTEKGKRATVTLTAQDFKSMTETLAFQKSGARMSQVAFDKDMYGKTGIRLTSNPFIGVYTAALPAADASGRLITLILSPDGEATLTSEYIGKDVIIVQTGTWKNGVTYATVSLTQQDNKPLKESFTFRWKGSQLVATKYSKTGWGSLGLKMARESLPIGDVYGFVSISDTALLAPDAVLTVKLVDVSKSDATPITLGQRIIALGNQPAPFGYNVKYDPSSIKSNGAYAIQATLTEGGKITYRTIQRYAVLTNGAPSTIDVDLDKAN